MGITHLRDLGRTWAAVMLVATTLLACGNDDDAGAPSAVDGTYQDSGPWAVGVTTLQLDDRAVEVWYPAADGAGDGVETVEYFIRDFLPDAIDAILPADANPPFETGAFRDVTAADDGPFPVVVFAHGFASYRLQSTFLTTHLASWGFVVVSADYLERGLSAVLGSPPVVERSDLDVTRQALDLVAAQNGTAGSVLEGIVDVGDVVITGHSAGGGTSRRFAEEADVIAYIPLSAGVRTDTVLPDKPSMWITGAIDAVAELPGVENAFATASAPKRLIVIDDAGHLQPSDICEIGANGGGVVQIAIDGGLPVPENLRRLGTDGCQPEAVPSPNAWKVVNHYVTAQVRLAFGIDDEPVGLSADVADRFQGVTFRYEEAL